MKLTNAQIRRYRSIEDGSSFSIEGDVTCMVGKNESGKTAVLQALYKSAPVEKSVTFDPALDYPSRLTRERRGSAETPVTTLSYQLSDADLNRVESLFGQGVIPAGILEITAGYGDLAETSWTFKEDEPAVIRHLLQGVELTPSLKARIDSVSRIDDFVTSLESDDATSPAISRILETVQGWRDSSVKNALIDELDRLRPRFVYFGDYDSMPGKVSIPNLIKKRDEDGLTRGEQALLSLLALAGVELEEFLAPDSHEHLIRDLENASNSISDEVFEFWSQNTDLAVRLTVIGKPETDAVAPLNAAPLLQIRVENQRHRVSVPFDERSRGFVWFFSFLAYFSQLEEQTPHPLILLLDEPGINLHASAQADLLRFIDERLSPKHQVLFSTHSPFMINPHHLERVRTVTDSKETGTSVSAEVLLADAETSFPLHAALGIELAQTLFVGPNVLLVEGSSDLIYLEVLSEALKSQAREGLDARWAIAPIGGVTKLPAFVTLLGANKLNTVVLADSNLRETAAVEKLRQAGKLGAGGIVLIGEITGGKDADIEDLFEPSLYVELVNRAYAGLLSKDPLTANDLPQDPRLVKRVERAFQARGINNGRLNHHSPAAALARSQADLIPSISRETLDKAQDLFSRINSFL